MTEYWKSNAMFWCDYCKVWMQDKPAARATHEKGIKHKDNVARKLREMRLKSDREVKDGKRANATMGDIEAKARAQYQEDLRDAHQLKQETTGAWVWDEESKLHYNDRHRYYYKKETQMYYGGDPPAWTLEPAMPAEARFPEAAVQPSTSGAGSKPGKQQAAGKGRPVRIQLDGPLAQLGGYQMPSVGAIGGAKGLGVAGASQQAKKRAAEHGQPGKGGEMSADEAAALARREAARARVQARTMASFGLK